MATCAVVEATGGIRVTGGKCSHPRNVGWTPRPSGSSGQARTGRPSYGARTRTLAARIKADPRIRFSAVASPAFFGKRWRSRSSKERVDERGQHGTLYEEEEQAQTEQHDQDRQHQVMAAFIEEAECREQQPRQ